MCNFNTRACAVTAFFICLCLTLNPAVCSGYDREAIPLAGQWDFALDANEQGITEKWYEKKLPENVRAAGDNRRKPKRNKK